MTNYLQVMTATLSYGMKFPDALLNIFIPVQKLGASSQSILSFDWLTKNGKLEYFTPSSAFMKVFFLAILPIALIILFLFVFGFLHLFLSKWFTDFKRNIAISTITILFLMHPTIVETTFGMFQCINIGEGIYKVRTDLNMSWYSFEHISWWLILGGPMILIWIVGWPSLALLFLIKNRKGLEEYKIQRYFIVQYYQKKLTPIKKISTIFYFLTKFCFKQ